MPIPADCGLSGAGAAGGGNSPTVKILCDDGNPGMQVVTVINVDELTGVPSATYFEIDGTPYVPVGDIVLCPDSDLESDPVMMCDGGSTTFIRWMVKDNAEPTGSYFDTDVAGSPYVVTSVETVGACPVSSLIEGPRAFLATGTEDLSALAGSNTVYSFSVKALIGCKYDISLDSGMSWIVGIDGGDSWGEGNDAVINVNSVRIRPTSGVGSEQVLIKWEI